MKAIRILPMEQSVDIVETDMSYRALQGIVGGDLQIAHEFDNGDVLYVRECGMIEYDRAMHGSAEIDAVYLFDLGLHQPFSGPGIIVGREGPDGRHGDRFQGRKR